MPLTFPRVGWRFRRNLARINPGGLCLDSNEATRAALQLRPGHRWPAVVFPMVAFRFTEGAVQHFATPSDKGGHNLRGFCLRCGSRISGAEDPQRGIIGVLASSLDDPTLFVPKFDMYAEDAQPWDVMDPAVKKFPKGMTGS